METAWIQIFILTFAECVAPVGKTVCQPQQFELAFVSEADCEYALQQLVSSKNAVDHIIVDRQKSACAPSAIERKVYESRESINAAFQDTLGWQMPAATESRRADVNAAHRERLAELQPCEETGGKAPCKIGEIIVEEASGEEVEVWKRD